MIDFVLTNFLPDDAFYYFEIVKNILAGYGPTFDGINLANGFHPLWLVILLPIFYFFSQPIYVTLFLCAILAILTTLVLWQILSRYTQSRWIKIFSLGIWFFNPYNMYESINGLETSLSLFFISLLVFVALKIRETNFSRRSLLEEERSDGKGESLEKNFVVQDKYYIWSGVIGGLMMLSRLDNLLIFVAFLVWLFVFNEKERIKKVFIVGIVASLVVLPWLIWNVCTFGTMLTSSGVVSTIVSHQLVVQDNGPGFFQTIKASIYFTYNSIQGVILQTGAPEIFLMIFGMFLGWLFFRKEILLKKISIRRLIDRPEIFLFLGFASIFILNSSVRWFSRTWYFVAFNVFLIMFVAWFFDKIKDKISYKKTLSLLLIIIILFSYYVSWSRNLDNREILQREMYAAALWSNENLPSGSKIGVLNAGIIGYFSEHTVVNLDGLVNMRSYEAIKERQLWNYVKEENLDYIIDFDIYLSYRYKSFWGIDDIFSNLELINKINLVDHGRSSSGISIYKIIK